MAICDLDEIKNQNILGKQAFLIDALKEIERIRRFGHRATFLLIKPHIKNNEKKEYYIKNIYSSIKNELRACDSVYLFSEDSFAVILPDTHEGGGESAALRIKRKISKIFIEEGEELASDIGVLCVGPEKHFSLADLLEDLEKDLLRDQRCQNLLVQEQIEKPLILILGGVEDLIPLLKKRFGYAYDIKLLKEDTDKTLCKKAKFILIEENFSYNHEKIQKDSYLKNKIELSFKDKRLFLFFSTDSKDSKELILDLFSLLLSKERKYSKDEKKRYKDVFSSISSCTHQMNQPLQIIMGKIELILLDLMNEKEGASRELFDSLTQIKEQIHYASEINQKINRLSKI